ncbi:MAG: hypothetical protein EA360_11665 [Balneolaceae bacterium]|nr:MAG: hypothetical protein EA360_11665 [Balneolaceae bacterium]
MCYGGLHIFYGLGIFGLKFHNRIISQHNEVQRTGLSSPCETLQAKRFPVGNLKLQTHFNYFRIKDLFLCKYSEN